MYQPVFNPYAIPQRKSANSCCVIFATMFIITMALAGVYVASSIMTTKGFLVVDLMEQTMLRAAFTDFAEKYEKTYSTKEEAEYRFNIFQANYKAIEEFNANPEKTCTLEVNKFADLTDDEFSKYYLSKSVLTPASHDRFDSPEPDNTIMKDWISMTTPVKDQGMCGSCWTFSSISIAETYLAIQNKSSPVVLSEQQLVDCCNNATDKKYEHSDGCNGGEERDALDYMKKKELSLEKDYPYKARNQACRKNIKGIKHNFTGQCELKTNHLMEEYIKNRTISVALAAGPIAFKFYKTGIVTSGCPGDELSHAVTIVGANSTQIGKEKVPYWVVRNSWGPNWGDNGYIKIMRTNKGNGMCGINGGARVLIWGNEKCIP